MFKIVAIQLLPPLRQNMHLGFSTAGATWAPDVQHCANANDARSGGLDLALSTYIFSAGDGLL